MFQFVEFFLEHAQAAFWVSTAIGFFLPFLIGAGRPISPLERGRYTFWFLVLSVVTTLNTMALQEVPGLATQSSLLAAGAITSMIFGNSVIAYLIGWVAQMRAYDAFKSPGFSFLALAPLLNLALFLKPRPADFDHSKDEPALPDFVARAPAGVAGALIGIAIFMPVFAIASLREYTADKQTSNRLTPEQYAEYAMKSIESSGGVKDVRINDITTLASVHRDGATLVYEYSLSAKPDPFTLRWTHLKTNRPKVCNGDTKVLLKDGVKLRFRFVTTAGVTSGDFLVSEADCAPERKLDEMAAMISDIAKKSVPTRIDEVTTLVDVRPGRERLYYSYSVPVDFKGAAKEYMAGDMRNNIKPLICTGVLRDFMNEGGIIGYEYKTPKTPRFDFIEFSKSDCSQGV